MIQFCYEYLPGYCFAGGVIGHPTRQCVKNHEENNGKLTSDALNHFTTTYLGLKGEINLRGKPIGSQARHTVVESSSTVAYVHHLRGDASW